MCHQCPHWPDVKTGKYDNAEFAKAPCSRCNFTGDNRPRHIAGGDVVTYDDSYAENAVASPEPVEDDGPDIPESMRVFFHEWLQLSTFQRDCLAAKLSDPALTLADIAKQHGVTSQAVHIAVHNANRRICRLAGIKTLIRRYRKRS